MEKIEPQEESFKNDMKIEESTKWNERNEDFLPK